MSTQGILLTNSTGIASSTSAGITPTSSDKITPVQEHNHEPIPTSSSLDQQPKTNCSLPTSSIDQQSKSKNSRRIKISSPLKYKPSWNYWKRRRTKSEPLLASLDTNVGNGDVNVDANVNDGTPAAGNGGVNDSTLALFRLVSRELEYIKATSKKLKDYEDLVNVRLESADIKLKNIDNVLKNTGQSAQNDGAGRSPAPPPNTQIAEIEKELRQFKKQIRKLKLSIPPKFKINPADLSVLDDHLNGSQRSAAQLFTNKKLMSGMPTFCKNEMFKESSEFK